MLTERQLLIFQAIIDEFVKSAHPVGSRAISKKENISVSAATIRNVMADLEEMGFLKKTHSSSGRIPSEKGYRYYVDHLVSPLTIDSSHVNVIKHLIRDGFVELEQIIQMSAEVLSDLTNYTTIILGPEVAETRLKQIQIVKLSLQTAVAILVTNTGYVEHRSFTIPPTIKASDIEKVVNILNERLYDVPIIQLQEMINDELLELMKTNVRAFDQTLRYLNEVFFSEQTVKLYVGGKANMLMQPEFRDVEKIQSFYAMMEKKEEIAKLLKSENDHLKVTIGQENEIDAIKDFTLITAPYNLEENQVGTIALLGPTRMEYRKVITLLKALSNEMTEVLYMWYKHNE